MTQNREEGRIYPIRLKARGESSPHLASLQLLPAGERSRPSRPREMNYMRYHVSRKEAVLTMCDGTKSTAIFIRLSLSYGQAKAADHKVEPGAGTRA